MEVTGMIRRVDDLGRIVIPKEIRRRAGISEGTPMEMLISPEGIILKKYYLESELSDMAQKLMDSVDDICSGLGAEKTGDIRRHILEIQKILKSEGKS